MHHFQYRNGVLHAEDVDLVALADKVGTPFYCYSTATLERHYQVFAGAFADLLSSIAAAKNRKVHVSLRVNPDVDARTHRKIATGKSENKFGIPISRAREVYARAAKLPGLHVAGVDMHIGSQITELAPFEDAFALLADFVRTLRTDGHAISHVDLGGGLGIPYREDNEPPPDPSAYAAVVKRATRGLDCKLIFEPGRLIVGNAGILVTRVIYLKRGEAKNFVIVDAAMNDLIRPTLYEAHHDIQPVHHSNLPPITADVVGPVCETGDYIALGRRMAGVKQGDLLSVMSAGAYGAVMASTHNSRP